MNAARKLIITSQQVDPTLPKRLVSGREKIHAELTEIIEPDAHRLRRSPAAVATLLLLFCGANTFGPFGDPDEFHGTELVSLLLDGLLQRGAE